MGPSPREAMSSVSRRNENGDETSVTTGSEDDTTLAPFDWSDILVAREKEAQQLLDVLKRASLSKAPTETFLIHGYSGVGKSVLLNSVLQQRPHDSFLFATGKYDQNKESELPLSAFCDATEELVRGIQVSHRKQAVMTRIHNTLTEAELMTMAVVFSCMNVFLPDAIKNSPPEESIVHEAHATEAALIRMMNIYRRFLAAIAEQNCTLIIFLDDLQWADDASRKLLSSIMSDKELCNIVLVGAIRDGEDSTFEPPPTVNGQVAKVVLSNLEEAELNHLVARVLKEDPQHTKSLSQVMFSRTMGNPFFAKQFLDALYRERLLTVNKTTNSFKWDTQMIAVRMKPSVDVADMLVTAIETLERKTQCVLIIASLLGHNFTTDVLEAVTGSIDLVAQFRSTLSSPGTCSVRGNADTKRTDENSILVISSKQMFKSLRKAQAVNLIESTGKDNEYRFIHDRIQQAARSLLPEGKTGKQIKATLGTLMLELARSNTSSSDDWMMYSAINLILKHGANDHEPNELASLCVQASKKSMSKAAFKSASKYAEAGIKTLGTTCWKNDDSYDLCLELHNLAVESLFSNGEHKRCKKRIAIVRKECRDVKHRFRAFNVLLHLLLAEDEFEECVVECREALQALGVKTTKKATSVAVVSNLLVTWRLVNGRSPKELEKTPKMENPYMEEACWIIARLGRAAYALSDENRLVLCCLQLFQITLRYGLNKTAPNGFGGYGLVLANIGHLESGYEYGASALSIAQRPDIGCDLAMSTAIIHCFSTHLKRPLLDIRPHLVQAIESGLQLGNAYDVSDIIRVLSWLGIHAGSTLGDHARELQKYCRTLREYKNRSNLALVLPHAQFVENVRGLTSNSTLLKGTFTNETKTVASFMESDKKDQSKLHQILTMHSLRVLLMYLNGQHVEAEEDRLRHADLKQETGTIVFKVFNTVYLALNCYALAMQQKTKAKKKKYTSIADRHVKTLRSVGKAGSPTMIAVVALLDAERLTCKGKSPKAAEQYRKAIHLLNENQFYMLEAIAYERLGVCLQMSSDNNESNSQEALREAWDKFRDHGAVMKLDRMRAVYGEGMFAS